MRKPIVLGLFAATLVAPHLLAHAESPANSSADVAAQQDPILRAMQAEMDREKAQLVLPGMQKPYFIEYRLDDVATFQAVANFGALISQDTTHQRVIRVNVRVGDYQTDSSSGKGEGSVELGALDDNPQAIRYALWSATDDAYKAALRAYSAKEAALKRFESAPEQADFADEKPEVALGPIVHLDINQQDWTQRVVEASGLYQTDAQVNGFAKDVQYSSANVHGVAVNRYLVTSEGSVVRHGFTGYSANVTVGGQAPDGMRLSRDNGTTGVTADELESATAFHQRTIDDLQSLEALEKAPLVSADDYHGPVLFSGDAAADVVDQLFVPNLEANRPAMGTAARTTGAYSSSLHAKVLPEFLSVTDDPSLKNFAGQQLLGSYAVDDEGVPAQSVPVVVNGKLQNYYVSRTPIRDFAESNGHGRAPVAQGARAQPGVVILKAKDPLSADALNAKLLSMAKEQERDVYEVQTMSGTTPRVLYLVHPDGKRELVRGAVFDELDIRSLRSEIQAAGNDPYVANRLAAVPSTTIVPSLLFGDIGVKRADAQQDKLPYYAPPPAE